VAAFRPRAISNDTEQFVIAALRVADAPASCGRRGVVPPTAITRPPFSSLTGRAIHD